MNALGFNYGQDQTLTYVKKCLQKLDNITSSIEDIQGQLNDIEKLSVDNKYMQVFTCFQERYDALLSDVSTAYNTFSEMDRQSKDNSPPEDLEKLCVDFANLLDTRYSDLESKVLQLGYALMGNTSAASATTKYSIMDTMTYFAEAETPFRNQRYVIENSVLVPGMTLYDYGHQMVQWDLGHELESYGVVALYLAADGSLIGFAYSDPNGDGTSVNYQCSLTGDRNLASQYGEDLEKLRLQNASYADFTRTAGLTAYNLAVRYEQQEKQKLVIWKKYAAMSHGKIDEKINVLETLNNTSFGTDVKTVTCAEFLSVSNGTRTKKASESNYFDFQINYDTFYNCTQKEFLAFVNAVKDYAGNRTFRQFLTDNGFHFPSNNAANYWLLGFDSDGYYQHTQTWDCSGYRAYKSYIAKNHSLYSVSVRLDDKIADFAKNPNFVKIQYFSQVEYENHYTACGQYDYTSFKNPIIVESTNLAYEPGQWTATGISSDGKNYSSNIIKYYTISGIGAAVNGLVPGKNVAKHWR